MHSATTDFVALSKQWPDDFEVHRQAAVAFDALSQALSQSEGYVNASNLDAAQQALQAAIDHAGAAAKIKQDDEIVRVQALFYKRLGDLTELRDRAAATKYFRQGLAVLDQIPAQNRENPLVRNARSSLLLGLGWNLGNLRDFKPALAALEEARDIRDRISQEDPKNVMALSFRTIPYRNLGIISGLAGKTTDQLHYFLQTCQIYDQLLAINPANETYRFSQAELRSDAANLMLPADPREAKRLGRLAIDTMKEAASSPQASAVELAITARSLIETKVPGLSDPKLALSLAQRSAALDAHDSEVMSILGEAYWANGDRSGAIRSAEQALALTGPTPTPERIELEAALAKYRKRD
jgi:tetratricopeptide (TPR) repeat protein